MALAKHSLFLSVFNSEVNGKISLLYVNMSKFATKKKKKAPLSTCNQRGRPRDLLCHTCQPQLSAEILPSDLKNVFTQPIRGKYLHTVTRCPVITPKEKKRMHTLKLILFVRFKYKTNVRYDHRHIIRLETHFVKEQKET